MSVKIVMNPLLPAAGFFHYLFLFVLRAVTSCPRTLLCARDMPHRSHRIRFPLVQQSVKEWSKFLFASLIERLAFCRSMPSSSNLVIFTILWYGRHFTRKAEAVQQYLVQNLHAAVVCPYYPIQDAPLINGTDLFQHHPRILSISSEYRRSSLQSRRSSFQQKSRRFTC